MEKSLTRTRGAELAPDCVPSVLELAPGYAGYSTCPTCGRVHVRRSALRADLPRIAAVMIDREATRDTVPAPAPGVQS